jgi:1-acyl-sn-glycerol-3-phosphate acyltransferase
MDQVMDERKLEMEKGSAAGKESQGLHSPRSQRLVQSIVRFLVNLIADVEISGWEYLPPAGALVVATNHIGIIDIVMFHYALDRFDMFIPVAEKWEERAWIRWLGRQLNFLFVDRYNPDLKALRKMINLMEQGNALVIAPEGTRSRTGGLIEGKPGAAFLAARSGFPVLPIAITGTEDKVILGNLKRLHRSHFTLTAGPTFIIPPLPKQGRDAALQAATDEIMCHIAVILPPRYRGVYADHPRLRELSAGAGPLGR